MRNGLLIVLVVFFISCGTKPESSFSRLTNDAGDEVWIGSFSKSDLERDFTWFKEEYEGYTVDMETMTTVKPYLKDVVVKVYMGTWCSDSQREVPHFFKIMDAIKFKKIEIVGLSEDKTTPDGLEKEYTIENVPTFIFLKDGKEVNRMVEYPLETLEKDMLAIFTTKSYKNPYADF